MLFKSLEKNTTLLTQINYYLQKLIVLLLFVFTNPAVFGQGNTVSGKVTDALTEEPLPGVNILIKGTQQGTVTNLEGEFNLEVSASDAELVFSYIGYNSENISVGNQHYFDVKLIPDIKDLEEIVVVGYGTIKKSDLTGSISSVKGEDIQKMPVLNAAEALQGKAAGVYVARESGRPGSGSSVKIRGVGSINNIDPLWVVDGVKGGSIGNVDNIESIEILKDASAAAIYGTDAAGGVILVTTKRGSNQKPKISFHSYYSADKNMNFPELLNSNQYSDVLLNTLVNDGIDTTGYNDYWNRDWNQSTDWADVMFQNGYTQKHNLSVMGGTETANYYISGGYTDQKGIYYGTGYTSFNFKINSDIKVTDWLTAGESVTFTSERSRPENVEIYRAIIRATPTIPIYDPTNIRGGGYGYIPDSLINQAQWAGGNPYADAELKEKFEDRNNLFANFYVDIKPFEGLSWRTNIAGRFNWDEDEYFQYPYYYSSYTNEQYNILRKSMRNSRYFMLNSFVTYNKDFGNHSMSVMQGFEASLSKGLWIQTSARDISNPDIRNTLLGDANYLNSNMSNNHGAEYSYFGRLNYSINNKYLVTGNYRIDASDKFSSKNSMAVFPSFSAGWRISEESFMQQITFLNDLKLRAGWGILGINNIPSYIFNSTYAQWGYTGFGSSAYNELVPGRFIDHFANESIQWEEISQWNYGIDFAVLENRLSGSLEYYDKTTSNMLVAVNIPQSSGYNITVPLFPSSIPARVNNGEISNKGADVVLTWKQIFNDLVVNISGNITYNKNNVVSLRDPSGTSFFIHSGVNRTEEGHPLASFYGYIADGLISSTEELEALNAGAPDGIYQNPGTTLGDIRYKDIASIDEDGNIVMIPDGEITAADQTFIGNPWPDWVYGLSITADWKSFDFAMFWQGVFGMDIYNKNKMFTEALFSDYNTSTRIFDAWSDENPDGDIPRVSYNDPNQNFQNVSSYFLEDGSYLRLKNIQLGYTIPEKMARKVAMSSARIYISGLNQITLTRYSGVDPEFASGGDNAARNVDFASNYPQYKSWVFGIQIDF